MFGLIRFLIKTSWWLVALAIGLGFLSGVSSAGMIALISQAIAPQPHLSATQFLWSFVGLAAIALLTSILSQIMLIRLAQTAVRQMQLRLCRQILAADLAQLERLGRPRLLATLTDDIQAVTEAVRRLPFLCIDLAMAGGCLVYIVWLSGQVFLLVLGLMVLAIGSSRWLLRRGRQWLTQAREEQDVLFRHFRSVVEGTKELKLHYWRRQAFLDEDLRQSAIAFSQKNIRGLTYFAITTSWGKLIFFFAVGFVLFVLPRWLAVGAATLSSYVLTFIYLMMPMERIMNALPVLSRATVALEKIRTLGLSLADQREATDPPLAPRDQWQTLTLKNVTYTYPITGDEPSFGLGPLDLTLHPGELVMVVGGNGSGKSTLLKLLAGLYVPETGEIRLDERVIGDRDREWYRQHFSVIFADFYLFERLLGLTADDLDAQAQQYLRHLQLDRKVQIQQGRLSTTDLSQGQRKRLALLTAYLEDRPIYIFDEWAADQDPLFKDFFYTELLPELRDRGKTIIAITHDDHYFHLGDRQIKLNYGQIEYDKQRQRC